jgi:hypothetical protein
MKRTTVFITFGILLVAVLLVVGLSRGKSLGDIPAGTGYSALDLCSRTMLSGEPDAQVRTLYIEPKVQPLPMFWRIEQSPKQRVTVSTSLPLLGHPRTAIYREGLGCTLVPPGVTEASVRAQPFVAAPPLPPDARAWPLGEGAPESSLLTAPVRALIERHASQLFGESSADLKQHHNTPRCSSRATVSCSTNATHKVTRVSNGSSAGR